MAAEYMQDPVEIEETSLAGIRRRLALSSFAPSEAEVVARVVQAAADDSLAAQFFFSDNAVAHGQALMGKKTDILCDAQMVVAGASHCRRLGQRLLCFLDEPGVATRAQDSGKTRSMAAIDCWRGRLQGSLAVVGNAPTALFRLLALIEEGEAPPALLVAVPVGFIGAAESKEAAVELWRRRGDFELIALRGQRGGSAVAASILNSLARLHSAAVKSAEILG